MKRLGFVLPLLMMTALLIGTVVCFSPYAPAAAPAPEDIEAIWSIEDARQESEIPLIKVLHNHGAPLGYDAESNVFYCTLGLDLDENWPEIHLTAPDVKGVQLQFVDDYTYDRCCDAVQDGYSYEVITYTEQEYFYTRIIFTGLPLVTIKCDENIGDVDLPMEIAVSSGNHESIISTGNIHLRGGSSKRAEKKNLKIEFTRSAGGKRREVSLPGIGIRNDILLNPMMCDELLVRDRLCWELYDQMLGDAYQGGFDARKITYAELFLNDTYYGVYLLMEPMEEKKELLETGTSHLLTDSVYRTRPTKYKRRRPILTNPKVPGRSYELRYEPADGNWQFAAMKTYMELLQEEDDMVFADKAASAVDIESAIRYVLLTQASALSDNLSNNMYIWARNTASGMRYQFVPWDMDMSWGKAWGGTDDKFGTDLDGWYSLEIIDRMIASNAGGAADLLAERWHNWKETIFDVNRIGALVDQYYNELCASGALMRNDMRWGYETIPESYSFIDFAEKRFAVIDRAVELIENRNEEFLKFLKNGIPGSKYARVYDF